jgi:hypothetical protein
MDAILDAGFPSRFRFYRIPVKHRAPIYEFVPIVIVVFTIDM